MSRILAGLGLLAIVAAPAAAAGYGFEASYTGVAVPGSIGALNVVVKPEIVRETSALARSSDGHYIAPRDAEDLVEELRDELVEQLGGRYVPGGAAAATLNVTIEQATPSNPAHTENGRNRNLDFRSSGRGGATVVATLVNAAGEPVAEYSYRWEESTFDVGTAPRIGWYGAERAFDRFANRLARELAAEAGQSGS